MTKYIYVLIFSIITISCSDTFMYETYHDPCFKVVSILSKDNVSYYTVEGKTLNSTHKFVVKDSINKYQLGQKISLK